MNLWALGWIFKPFKHILLLFEGKGTTFIISVELEQPENLWEFKIDSEKGWKS